MVTIGMAGMAGTTTGGGGAWVGCAGANAGGWPGGASWAMSHPVIPATTRRKMSEKFFTMRFG